MVGPSLRRLRKSKKLTQDDLAQWLGVSRQAVAMWEAEKRELKATTLKKIAMVFGVGVDEIIKLDKNDSKKKEEEMPRKKTQKKVNFQLKAPEANRVLLTGDFTSWNQDPIPMKRNRSGLWKTGVNLGSGRYEYKFIVDDQWWTDPENSNTSQNSFGDSNSVLEIGG